MGGYASDLTPLARKECPVVSQSGVEKARKIVTVDGVFPWNGLRELQALSRLMLVVVKIVVKGKEEGVSAVRLP